VVCDGGPGGNCSFLISKGNASRHFEDRLLREAMVKECIKGGSASPKTMVNGPPKAQIIN
jgi:hypothetical protein